MNCTLYYSDKNYGLLYWGCRAVVRLFDPKLKTLGERGIECIFVGYAEHCKAFGLYVIEPNDPVSINSIIELRYAIFDENRFLSVPRPSLRISNGTKYIGGSVVPEEVTKEVVQQTQPELKKSKRNRTPKDFGPEFQLYLIEGTNDKVSDQHFYCFNIKDDPKTFNKAMISQDVAFWKEAINDDMDSIIGNNTWVLADLPPGCKPFGCKWIFKRKLKMDVKTTFLNDDLDEEVYMNQPQGFIMPGNDNKVDLIKEFVSSKFFIKDMGEIDVILGIKIKPESNGIAISQSHYIKKQLKKFNYFDCTLVSTPMDTSEKLMPNNGQVISQLDYSRVIGCLMYAMTCTRPDIAFVVGKLSRYTSNPVLEGYNDTSWISNTEDNASKSGWVFLLGGATAGKEAKWLKKLLLEIPLWSKPIAPISIRCDSAATLAKAYSQMNHRKSRHFGVRHSMIRELITSGVIHIEFVSSQQKLADHLTKGLARDLVIKSAEWM
nr:zinc finger, CCHC-type [Tanacetum cinerariifolium]